MAEHRAIKSAIWEDAWFGRLSPFEMAVWIGLFSKCADDQGRLQDDPALIRSKLFPFQDVTMKEIDAAMATFNGHIIRYEKVERLAQLVRWFDNQPMQYAVPSNFPPPDGWIDRYRTNYKGSYIVYNWNGLDNTSIGILLWKGLSTLQRPSSWIAYLGTLNPNPNPNPVSKPEVMPKTNDKKKSATPPVVFPANLNCTEFMEAWIEWDKFRSEIKHKLTPTTIERQLADLSKYPVKIAIAMIDQSITKGWQGLFPLKSNGNGHAPISEPTRIDEWDGRDER